MKKLFVFTSFVILLSVPVLSFSQSSPGSGPVDGPPAYVPPIDIGLIHAIVGQVVVGNIGGNDAAERIMQIVGGHSLGPGLGGGAARSVHGGDVNIEGLVKKLKELATQNPESRGSAVLEAIAEFIR